MADVKNQVLESKRLIKSTIGYDEEGKKLGKMKGLPDIFLKTSEIQNCSSSNSPQTRDASEK